jgi:hypothetical protein
MNPATRKPSFSGPAQGGPDLSLSMDPLTHVLITCAFFGAEPYWF